MGSFHEAFGDGLADDWTEEKWLQELYLEGLDPAAWINKGEVLLRAAAACYEKVDATLAEINRRHIELNRLIEEDPDNASMDFEDLHEYGHVTDMGHMLTGFAIENALKAVIASRMKSKCEAKLPKELAGHDLVRLARIAQLSINEREHLNLQNLTRYVVWSGRYPVPKSWERYREGKELRTKLRNRNVLVTKDIRSAAMAVFSQCVEKLDSIAKPR